MVAEQLLENQAFKEIAKGNRWSPSRRREAVSMLQERLSVSERRACRITGRHRWRQRHGRRRGDRDEGLRTRLGKLFPRASALGVSSCVGFAARRGMAGEP